MLQSGRGYNALQLATECQISKRTIFRDLELLREARVPLVYDEVREQYRIAPDVLLPPTSFAPDEALSLLLLSQDLGKQEALPFLEPARRAALKVESSLPGTLRDYLRDVGSRIGIRPEPHCELTEKAGFYQLLVDAIASRHCLRMSYDSFSEEGPVQTKLSPYHLLFSRRSWYVIGRSANHRAVRTFNLNRIQTLAQLDEKFTPPRRFTIERFLRNAWSLIAEKGPDYEVVIRFEKKVARNVAEVMWHKTQRIEFQPDGSCIFRVTVSGLREIVWWIMGYSDQALVLEPPLLRDEIARMARRLAERYGCETAVGATQ